MKKVTVLINEIGKEALPDESDVLVQAASIERALQDLGYDVSRLFLNLNLEQAAKKLKKSSPAFVFNLVESLEGSGRLIHLAPALLEHLYIPFTGCRSDAMYITSHKILAKTLLKKEGIRTPGWYENPASLPSRKKIIAKPLWEDASLGIGDENVFQGTPRKAFAFLREHPRYRYFFEEYIEGREFNVSVLGGDAGPEVLPLAEIAFEGYPEKKPRIVGYDAKWQEGSFEYVNTKRTFGSTSADPELASSLREMAIRCWKLFRLTGYARVDFRVDKNGKPWVLEVNANPCLSDDAGLVAAAAQAGYGYKEIVKRIIEDVWM